MKTLKTIILFAIYFTPFLLRVGEGDASAQCLPLIAVDGNNIVADENNVKGLKLPAWLIAGQTLAKGQFVYSISVMEFSVNGSALDFSQNKKVTNIETVPTGKTWKIESIMKDMALPSSSNGVYVYSTPGTYVFTTPACITVAQVQVWGAGGSGGGGYSGDLCGSGGGGAGGYSEGAFQLAASTNYTITIGAGGASKSSSGGSGSTGGTSSVGTIGIGATGGAGGLGVVNAGCGQAGGAGGTGSGGQINFTGQAGATNDGSINGGIGGDAPNGGGAGGAGGNGTTTGFGGSFPGGGGGGGSSTSPRNSGAGGNGKIVITLGTGAAKVPCVTLYQYGITSCTNVAACPSGWTDAGCGLGPNGTWQSYTRTCYRCD